MYTNDWVTQGIMIMPGEWVWLLEWVNVRMNEWMNK